jgi:hypothetical protein
MKSSFASQRKHLRVAWRLPVRIESSLHRRPFDATTFNVSAGGLCLLPSRPLPVDTEVMVELRLPEGVREVSLRLQAHVVREVAVEPDGDGLLGVQFENVSTRERNILREAVLHRALARVQSIAEYQAFRSLSDLDLLELASVSHELELWTGDHAAHYGDEATSVFLVKRGAVELRAPADPESAAGEPQQVEVARAGHVFGEAAALLGLPHNLDVVAVEETEVLVLPRAALQYLRDRNPQLALMLYEIFAAFMGRRVRRLTGRLISPLSY